MENQKIINLLDKIDTGSKHFGTKIFKLVNNLISSSLDKVTIGTYNLQSVILSVAPVEVSVSPPSKFISRCILVITQFLFHFNSKDTSQLINGIFNALQKLPKYFNGMASSILFLPELFSV